MSAMPASHRLPAAWRPAARASVLASVLAGVLIALFSAAASAAGAASPVLDRIRDSGRIVIAHRESSVPFSYLDADRRPVGYTLDLCRKVADAVGRHLGLKDLRIEYRLVTPADRLTVVQQGQADLECGSTTNNADRRQKVAFTVPHYITGARYMVRADSPIAGLEGFEKRRLVSTRGTTPLQAIQRANQDRLLRIGILEAPDHARAVDMVARGEADGFAMDDVLLVGLIAGRPDAADFKVVGKFLTIEPLAIMMSRDDPAFKAVVDAEMRRLIYSREAHAVYERWFQRPIPPRNTALGLPMNHLLKDFWKYPSDQVP